MNECACIVLGWLARILQSSLVNWFRDGEEIRRLIQAFLSARAAALSVSRLQVVPTEDSQNWEDFDVDINDPAVLALVDGRQSPREKDQETTRVSCVNILCQSANHLQAIQVLSSAIYNLVNKYFASEDKMEVKEIAVLGGWIECWAQCAHVLVQNKLKVCTHGCQLQRLTCSLQDWSHYLQLGTESWARIISPTGRRQVGLHFMLTVLRLDPSAYEASSMATHTPCS